MSLDFYLILDDEKVFSKNITHNLSKMANAADLYAVLWRPDEHGYTKAHECIPVLTKGLIELITHKSTYSVYDDINGWGMYAHFIPFVTAVLTACAEFPTANVVVSR